MVNKIRIYLKEEQQDTRPEHFLCLHPNLRVVIAGIHTWFLKNGKRLTLTSIYREESSTHSDFRACDIRVRDLTYDECKSLVDHINSIYKERYAAFNMNGEKVLIVHFNENEEKRIPDHLHIQVCRILRVP